MVLSTGALRGEYGPACHDNSAKGAQDAWDAHQQVMEHYGYQLRAGDTGSRSCRPITGGSGYSLHAYFLAGVVIHLWNLPRPIAAAVAGDFNWNTNPYGSRLVTDMSRAMVDAICAIRTVNGKQVFRWGGYYSGNKDAMHYELVCAKADLTTGIDWSTVAGHSPGPTPPKDDDMTPEQEAKLDAVLALAQSYAAPAVFSYAGSDLNAFVVRPNGDLVQCVYLGDGEERPIAHGCIPGPVPYRLNHAGVKGRIDAFGFYPEGGFVICTFDPAHQGNLPGGWSSADFARPKH